jgi:hypothetical protein
MVCLNDVVEIFDFSVKHSVVEKPIFFKLPIRASRDQLSLMIHLLES